MIDELLQHKRSAPSLTSGLFFACSLLLLIWVWSSIPQVVAGVLLLLWLFVAVRMYLKRQRLQQLEALEIPAVCLRQFQQRYPQLKLKQRRLIEQGFKDYLSLHVLSKQAYAMPSGAVDALWHVMLAFPDQYQQFCQQALGRPLRHHVYTQQAAVPDATQTKQLMATWRGICQLHRISPRKASYLPRLFAIDQALAWQGGHVHDLSQLKQQYARSMHSHSDSSDCGSSCGSCGGD